MAQSVSATSVDRDGIGFFCAVVNAVAKLLDIFARYATSSSSGMTTFEFYHLVRDARVLDNLVTVIEIIDLYDAVTNTEADGGVTSRCCLVSLVTEMAQMSYESFQRAITALALRRMAHMAPDKRTDALVDQFIISHCTTPSTEDAQVTQFATAEAVDVVRSYRMTLGKLYSLYATRDTQPAASWADVLDVNGSMIALSFARFMEDMDVTPDLLGRAAVQRLIRISASASEVPAKREMQVCSTLGGAAAYVHLGIELCGIP